MSDPIYTKSEAEAARAASAATCALCGKETSLHRYDADGTEGSNPEYFALCTSWGGRFDRLILPERERDHAQVFLGFAAD